MITESYCISLTRRYDRREKITEEFCRIGIAPPTFVDAVDGCNLEVPELCVKRSNRNAKYILACAESHKRVLKNGFNNSNTICVFEDDVHFCDDFLDRYNYVNGLGLEWDVFYLGGHFDHADDMESTQFDHIYKINKNVAGTYAYAIKKHVAEYVIRNLTYNYGIDEFYSNYVQRKFRCLTFYPFMAGTYDGYSDIALNNTRYNEEYKGQFIKERIKL